MLFKEHTPDVAHMHIKQLEQSKIRARDLPGDDILTFSQFAKSIINAANIKIKTSRDSSQKFLNNFQELLHRMIDGPRNFKGYPLSGSTIHKSYEQLGMEEFRAEIANPE